MAGLGSSNPPPRNRWFSPYPIATAKRDDNVMKGILTLSSLKDFAEKDEIDTVIIAITDCYGRMLGKRFSVDHFLESAVAEGTHGCCYLLATDMDMESVPGYRAANWEQGYGDFHIVPDMHTLRRASWLEKTALVLCNVENDKHEPVSHAPRSVLQRQVTACHAFGEYTAMAASELEYFIYQQGYESAKSGELEVGQEMGYKGLKPIGWHREDYHILQGTREEFFNAPVRRHLAASGVPVENSKGEYGVGQHEINVKYCSIVDMADRHIVLKQCMKEIADAIGCSITFMAKPDESQPGSSCHIHLSLWKEGKNVFDGNSKLGDLNCSEEFRWFLGGWMKHCSEMMVFYAPTVNSYKRFVSSSWAPTAIAWSIDNRTASFRIVGSGKSLRIECRLPGADCNPYLAFAAVLASGIDGIKNKIEPPPMFQGDAYRGTDLQHVPKTLLEALDLFEKSEFALLSFGEDVHKHYCHFFRTECRAFDRAVTDWEKARYFEQI